MKDERVTVVIVGLSLIAVTIMAAIFISELVAALP